MRWVDRSLVKEPPSLAKAGGKAEREMLRAKRHFSATNATIATLCKTISNPQPATSGKTVAKGAAAKKIKKKAFNFSAYKADDVKLALEELFHKKCAYCESKYSAVVSVQVEHFRPKGRVDGEPNHTGYWWLAATWTNLLPSCVHCNGTEYHEIRQFASEPAYDQATQGTAYKLGKYDCFPISGKRALNNGDDLTAEDALLIDPTRQDPAQHLQWVIENGLSLVAPRKVNATWDPYGWATYRVFGLNRQGLVEMRTDLMLQVINTLERAEKWLTKAATMVAGEDRKWNIDQAFDLIASLEPLAAPSQPYSAMVRSLLDESRQRLFGKFSPLLAAVSVVDGVHS